MITIIGSVYTYSIRILKIERVLFCNNVDVCRRTVISHTKALDQTRLVTFVTDKDYHGDKAVSFYSS